MRENILWLDDDKSETNSQIAENMSTTNWKSTWNSELELHKHYGIRNDFLLNNFVMFFFAVVVKAAGINSRTWHSFHRCVSTDRKSEIEFFFLSSVKVNSNWCIRQGNHIINQDATKYSKTSVRQFPLPICSIQWQYDEFPIALKSSYQCSWFQIR